MISHPESTAARAVRDYAQRLRLSDRVFAGVYREIVRWLAPAPRAVIADVGCGAGGMTAALRRRLSPSGTVTAFDVSGAHLAATRETLDRTPGPGRALLTQGSVDALPLADASIDLLWCSHVVHGQPDPLASLRELRRVLMPGGRLALREDFHLQHTLPGDASAGLELRLGALEVEAQAHWRAQLSGAVRHQVGWPGLLRQAGFVRIEARTFTLDLLLPLDHDQEAYLAGRLEAWKTDYGTLALLTEADRAALLKLSDPDDQEYLLRRPDLHVVEGVTVYLAQLAQAGREAGTEHL